MEGGQLHAPAPVTRRKRLQKRKEQLGARFGKKKISCTHRESNHDLSVAQPLACFLQWLSYPTSKYTTTKCRIRPQSTRQQNDYGPNLTKRRAPGAFVRWRLILECLHLETHITSPSWRLEFWVPPSFIENLCTSPAKCSRLPSSQHAERCDENVGSQTYGMHCCSTRANHLTKLRQITQQIYIFEQQQMPRCTCCPRSLRRGSAAARLLGLRVRIPPGAWMSVVNVVCGKEGVSATDRSLVQTSPTGVCVCNLVQQ